MAEYRLTDTDIVVRTYDGASIPNDPFNEDRVAYEAWLADGGVPDPALGPSLQQIAANERWSAETDPLWVANVVGTQLQISMDRLSQERIATIVGSYYTNVLKGTITYKAINGFFVMAERDMEKIHTAIQTHIQACFAKEKEVVDQIAAGIITTEEQIQAAFVDLYTPLVAPMTNNERKTNA